jgi:hypothetical protein
MVVPQGMSYAQNLAFLPQVYGLYGAFTPCIFYALLGSSRQLVSRGRQWQRCSSCAFQRRPSQHARMPACALRLHAFRAPAGEKGRPSSPLTCTHTYARAHAHTPAAHTPTPSPSLFLDSAQAVGPVAVTSLILRSGLSDIYGKFGVNPSDPKNALIAYKQQQYNVGAIQVAFLAGLFYTGAYLMGRERRARSRGGCARQ